MYRHYPLFRPLAAYVFGIVSACWLFPGGTPLRGSVFLLLSVAFMLLCTAHFFYGYRSRLAFGLLLFPLFAGFGVMSVLSLPHVGFHPEMEDGVRDYAAFVDAPPDWRASTVRLQVRISHCCRDGHFVPVRERCLLSVERDSASECLQYGDRLLFRADLKEAAAPRNEGEFDYRRYLFRKGIRRQSYLPAGHWSRLEGCAGSALLRCTSVWRSKLTAILEESHLDSDAKGLAATMLLGNDVMLDPELSQAYARGGVSHILCVSGMHVGILYLFLDSMLFFLNGKQWQRMLKLLLLLASIWTYACVVALSASVVRSSVMFSFVSLGKIFRQQVRTYNSLLTSALLMLLLNPLMLFEIGFQMSFLAVWGIVWVQPMLAECWQPKNRVMSYLWNVWSVSIAAQLFTSPLSVACFHQFPTYFLLSNLIVVAIAPCLIGAALFFLVFSSFPGLSVAAVFLLEFLARVMNWGVVQLSALPGSCIQGLSLLPVQVGLLYLSLLLLLLSVQDRNAVRLCWFMGCFSVFLASGVIRQWQNRRLSEIVVYAVPHHFAAQVFLQGGGPLFVDDAETWNQGGMDYSVKGLQYRRQALSPLLVCSDTFSRSWVRTGDYLLFQNQSFFFVKKRLWADTSFFLRITWCSGIVRRFRCSPFCSVSDRKKCV